MANNKMSISLVVVLLAGVCSVIGAPLSGIARNVKSDLVLVNKVHASAGPGSRASEGGADLPVGHALDLFYRYGFFSLSVRVVPRDDAGSWLIREPTVSVFEDGPGIVEVQPEANSFDSNFQVFFCDDESELMEAYFRDFTAEGIEEPHKLYTGSWHATTRAKYFGVAKEVLGDGDSAFVLVKLNKRRSTHHTGNSLRLRSEPLRAISSIQIGNPESVLTFVKNFGSHFVQSVTVGDAVYQVYVLSRDQYQVAKGALVGNGGQPSSARSVSPAQMSTFAREHLAPWQVKEAGAVLAASGNKQVLAFLDGSLREQGQFGTYSSIFRLQEDPSLMSTLESLTSQDPTGAVVAMNFASLRSWVPDIQAREFYDGTLETQAALWGSNI